MKLPQRTLIESILIGVVSAVFVIALSLIPVLNILILLWPVPTIVHGARRGMWACLLSFLTSAMIISLVLQPMAGIILAAACIIPVTCLAYGFRRRLYFYESVLLSSGSVLVSVIALLKAYSVISGHSAFDVLWASITDTITNGLVDFNQLLPVYHQMGLFTNFTTDAQLAGFIVDQLKLTVPASILIFSLIYGVLLYSVSHLMLKRLHSEAEPAPPFEEWILPRGMGFGFLVLLLVAFLGSSINIPNFQVVQLTITSLIMFIFTVQGLSVLWFFMKAGRVPGVLRWILAVVAYVFFHVLLTFNMGLTLLGIFDHIFGLRKGYRKKFLVGK